MATKCPNKSSKEWGKLVSNLGETTAYKVFLANNEEVPEMSIIDDVISKYKAQGNVNYNFKSIQKIFDNKQKVDQWSKQIKDVNKLLDKVQKDLGIPKDQIDLIRESDGNTIDEKLTSFITNYSYTVEVNTAKESKGNLNEGIWRNGKRFEYDGNVYEVKEINYTPKYFKNNQEISFDEIIDAEEKLLQQTKGTQNTQYYSNLTVPGGTNYTENEISTPLIIPSIKGHAQFSTDQGIGWFRSDEQVLGGKQIITNINDSQPWEDDFQPEIPGEENVPVMVDYKTTKTRRILEVQSDLFQKGRDNKYLTGNTSTGLIQVTSDPFLQKIKKEVQRLENESELPFVDTSKVTIEGREYERLPDGKWYRRVKDEYTGDINKNQFLQLLNKDNNWVTFFIKSIIQDSAKKGYEKVLFPKGETAAKIEGHETIADEIRRKDKDIEALKSGRLQLVDFRDRGNSAQTIEEAIEIVEQEKANLKSQGIEKLKPIEAFYEIKVGNILEKQFGKDNVKTITDEYGNQWREITIKEEHKDSIVFKTEGFSDENLLNQLINEYKQGKITYKQYKLAIQSRYGIPQESVDKAMRKYEIFRRFVPKPVSISFNELIPYSGKYDRKNNSITLNPLMLAKDTVGHEFGHILLYLMNGMKNPLIKQVRDMFRGHPLEAKVLEEYKGKYDLPEMYDLEIVAYVLGFKSNKAFRLFEEQEKRSKLARLVMRILEWFRSHLGMEKDPIRKLLNMMLTDKVITDKWEVRKEEQEIIDNQEVYRSIFTRRKKAKEKDIDEILADVTEDDVYSLGKLKDNAVEVIERKIRIYKSKNSKVPIEMAKRYLDKVNLSETPEEALYNFIELADNSTNYIYGVYKLKKHNENISIDDLEYWKTYVSGFGLIDKMLTALYDEYKRFAILNPKIASDRKARTIFSDIAFDKMKEISRKKNEIVNFYIIEGSKQLSIYLAPHYKHIELRKKEKLEREYNKLSKEERSTLSLEQYLENEMPKYKESIEKSTLKSIREEILKAGRDVNQLTRWLDTIVDSSDPVISAMVNAFTEQDFKIHRETVALQREFVDKVSQLENFYNNKYGMFTDLRKMYDFMLEKDDKGQYTGYLLTEIKGGFDDKLREQIDAFRKEYPNASEEEISEFVGQWYKSNGTMDWAKYETDLFAFVDSLYEPGNPRKLSKQEIENFKNATRLKRSKYIMSLMSYDTIDATETIANPRILEEINTWVYENKRSYYSYNEEWINKDFSKLKKILSDANDPRAIFYNYIIEMTKKHQRYIPYSQRIEYRIPAVIKDTAEYASEKQYKKAAKEKLKRTFSVTDEDEENRGIKNKVKLIDEEGNPLEFIPILYTQPITETDDKGNKKLRDDISLDLGTSFYKFFKMTIDYKHKREILPQMEMARFFVNNRQYKELDSSGNTIMNSLSVNIEEESTKEGKNSVLASMLNDWFRSVFYGVRQEDEGFIPGIGIDIAKGMDAMNSYTAINMLGLNFVQGTANALLGHANDWIEAFGGINYTPKNFIKADKYYTMHLVGTLGDIGQRKSMGIINMLNDLFDTLHDYGDGKMKDNNLFKTLFKKDALFATTKLGEHMIQSKVMLAMLDNLPAYDSKGNKIGSILDMYTVKKGELAFKPEFDLVKSKWTDKEQKDFHFKLNRLLADLHGDYYRNSIPAWQRLALGRMAGLFRKFIVPGYKRRWGSRHPDTLRGTIAEGYYRTFLRFAHELLRSLWRHKLQLSTEDWRNLTSAEKANVKKTTAELAFLLGAVALITVFTKLKGDDDDDPWVVDFAYYQSYRFMAEMSFFFNPVQTMNILRSPAASLSMVENSIQLIGQLLDPVDGPFERFERGNWKGHMKIEKHAINLFAPGYKQWYRMKYINDQVGWFK